MSRILFWGVVVGAAAVTIWMASRPRPILVDVAEVGFAEMDVRVEEDGRTRIRERYIVSTPLAGQISRITLDVGDDVVADRTVLARMEATDPTLLDPRAVAQAQARVRASERKLEAAKSQLVRSESTLSFAEKEMGRMRQLRQVDAASELEFAEKELTFRQSTEEVRTAGLAVDIAEYELDLEKAALLLTDPEQRSKEGEMELAITAPIDGRVLRIYQESTAVVPAGASLMDVGDPTDLEVVADVLSRDAVRISAGDHVVLRHWGGQHPLQGRVRLVEPSGFTKLSALGVEEQRVNVVIDLLDAAEKRKELGDGFRVDCEIIVWDSENALQIPVSALFRVNEQWSVFAIRDSAAHLLQVDLGQRNGRVAEVLGGLEAGDFVIMHPSDAIEEGVQVSRR
ncbi:MAG: efflux RND transporter periplasmic adaptor subunit [Rubripirellula sp.]